MVVVDDRTVDSRNGLNALRVDGSCLLLMMQPLSRQTPPYTAKKLPGNFSIPPTRAFAKKII